MLHQDSGQMQNYAALVLMLLTTVFSLAGAAGSFYTKLAVAELEIRMMMRLEETTKRTAAAFATRAELEELRREVRRTKGDD